MIVCCCCSLPLNSESPAWWQHSREEEYILLRWHLLVLAFFSCCVRASLARGCLRLNKLTTYYNPYFASFFFGGGGAYSTLEANVPSTVATFEAQNNHFGVYIFRISSATSVLLPIHDCVAHTNFSLVIGGKVPLLCWLINKYTHGCTHACTHAYTHTHTYTFEIYRSEDGPYFYLWLFNDGCMMLASASNSNYWSVYSSTQPRTPDHTAIRYIQLTTVLQQDVRKIAYLLPKVSLLSQPFCYSLRPLEEGECGEFLQV